MNIQLKPNYLKLLFLSLIITGCGSGGGSDPAPDPDPDPDPDSIKSLTIDATAGGFGAAPDDPKNKYTYINLDTGQVVELTDAEAETSLDWHLAFKRTKPKLNGGGSGPGTVKAALADAQDEYYEASGDPNASVFLNANADQELQSLKDVADDTGLDYVEDRKDPEIIGDGGTDSWWSYDPATHTISANPDAWNIVRGSKGKSFAKLHVTNIVQASRDITIEMNIQGDGETAFDMNPTIYTANIGATGGEKCYDFDTKAEVDCAANAADWDIQVEVTADGRSWNIWTNGGIRGDGSMGGRFGTVSSATIGNYPDATAVPKFFKDAPSGLLLDSKTRWYAYNLQGGHKIWPNYRVYVIDTGAKKYKAQVTSYYHPTDGTSGVISLRYKEL
ncbi:MAG TPA: hypothetical protein EYP51_01200 [Thiotrichales bacterium]|nr:hypothetical protein [Thiotrichales bacterium]